MLVFISSITLFIQRDSVMRFSTYFFSLIKHSIWSSQVLADIFSCHAIFCLQILIFLFSLLFLGLQSILNFGLGLLLINVSSGSPSCKRIAEKILTPFPSTPLPLPLSPSTPPSPPPLPPLSPSTPPFSRLWCTFSIDGRETIIEHFDIFFFQIEFTSTKSTIWKLEC